MSGGPFSRMISLFFLLKGRSHIPDKICNMYLSYVFQTYLAKTACFCSLYLLVEHASTPMYGYMNLNLIWIINSCLYDTTVLQKTLSQSLFEKSISVSIKSGVIRTKKCFRYIRVHIGYFIYFSACIHQQRH